MNDISVIIPTNRYDERLLSAIRSALYQTYAPKEVIVCDVADLTERTRIEKTINDPRLRWVYGGADGLPSIPRNRGIAESTGEWLAFLDSDDEWKPTKLEKQMVHITNGAQAVCTNANRVVPSIGITGKYFEDIDANQNIGYRDLLRINGIICSSVLANKDLVVESGCFPEDRNLVVGEDYSLWLRISTRASFLMLAEALVTYRDDPAASIRSRGRPYWQQRRIILISFYRWLSGNKPASRFISFKYSVILQVVLTYLEPAYHIIRMTVQNCRNRTSSLNGPSQK